MNAILATFIGFMLLPGTAAAQGSDVELGGTASNEREANFYLAISEHYHVPPLHIAELHDRYRCADEELPVVYALAASAHVAPATIVSLRVTHKSWLDIILGLGLTPEVFFVPVPADPIGPPFGHAYGYFRKYGASRDWTRMPLTDSEIVALVNLKFLSEYYRTAPEAVIAMRDKESSFVVINDEFKREHAERGRLRDKGNGKKQ